MLPIPIILCALVALPLPRCVMSPKRSGHEGLREGFGLRSGSTPICQRKSGRAAKTPRVRAPCSSGEALRRAESEPLWWRAESCRGSAATWWTPSSASTWPTRPSSSSVSSSVPSSSSVNPVLQPPTIASLLLLYEGASLQCKGPWYRSDDARNHEATDGEGGHGRQPGHQRPRSTLAQREKLLDLHLHHGHVDVRTRHLGHITF
jgi:hypothetical protein